MLFADMLGPIEKQLDQLPREKKEEFDKMFNLTFEEWTTFQEKKSIAQAEGRMDLDNALWVYNTLGSAVTEFNSRPLAVKYLMTQIFKRLLTPGN